ncbi:MAG TPA: hypothetical protein EYQ09_06375, partial [Flavobacteriales bacterium]|nr:hypothetical protein [Flavobacteriales bacterium]
MKKIILLVVILSTFFTANATHMMGGEITWVCIKDPLDPDVGKYIFTMKMYRDCDGTSLPTSAQTIYVWDHLTVTQLSVDFVSNTDISPIGNSINSGNTCLDCNTNPVGAVEEYIYISQPVALPGLPPATGWHFTWDSCCRNGATSNLLLSSTTSPGEGFTLRASMFPYFDPSTGLQIPADPCFDSSPLFNESPKTIICTGYPFAYSHNASDVELDAIAYFWDEPLDDFAGAYNPAPAGNNPPFVQWLAPYTVNAPLPGGVNLDPVTGEISYNSNISGNFATVVRVDAYKCTQLVSSIYREIQAVLIACPTMSTGLVNNPPTITAPVGAQIWTTTLNPSGLPSYSTTISAGAYITFDIVGNDMDLYATGIMQDITMEISGGQMAVDYITASACDNPPCATFTDLGGNPPPIAAPSVVSGVFEWQTDCNQLSSDAGCGATTNIFTFLVKVYDDFCPANAITIATMKITILPSTFQPAPLLQCVTESSSGDVYVSWNHNSTANNSTIYHIYGADNISGPYTLLSTAPYPSDSYSFLAANIPPGIQYYYMRLESACANISDISDTIMPIQLDINSTNVNCWDDTDGRIAINMISTVITPFTYYLDGVPNPNAYPLDSVWENLPAGIYDVTVSDNGSCIITTPISITAPGLPLQALVSGNMNVCYGDSVGFAVGFGSGGTPGYSYEWFDASYTSFSLNDTVFGLSSGSYYLEVMDVNGCDTFTSVQVIAPQTALSGSPQMFGVVCKGDSTGVLVGDAQGSWAPYQYYWLSSTGDTLQR